ncbi:hypothetical protein PVAND_006181 [Polypedilum vanderplanki]|uniref:Uncharacterized protein n=1 Tax=Polypedilum vanderplanki TaxID=319348 RepID=A0A9J6C2U3_POLVA|nr:hypothetical protein PVAND_006181 [Polypedilum vanderplanki]
MSSKLLVFLLLFYYIQFHGLVESASKAVGQCQRSDGKCKEAQECKYIWTDTIDCTVKQLVCCYNDHDYVDLG